VVALGDAAMLTAQVLDGQKFGMNMDGLDNRQFSIVSCTSWNYELGAKLCSRPLNILCPNLNETRPHWNFSPLLSVIDQGKMLKRM